MPTEHPINLVGAGGHALVVIDALLASGFPKEQLRLYDQRDDKVGTNHLGLLVERLDLERRADRRFHICIGSNDARLALGKALEAQGGRPMSVIHPAAIVSVHAEIKAGCFLAAGAVVGPLAFVESYSIVNHSAVVDHECRIGEGCHIASGAVLGGAVTVERLAMVGAGARILPRVKVGQAATIGAGAVIVRDVGAGKVQVGVPARDLPER